jgi:hypothetical protein
MQHGIIGAVAAIVALSSVPRLDASLSQSANGDDQTQLTAGGGVHIEQATQLLETVKCKCEGSWRAGVFFYDELASALITVLEVRTLGHSKECSLYASNKQPLTLSPDSL